MRVLCDVSVHRPDWIGAKTGNQNTSLSIEYPNVGCDYALIFHLWKKYLYGIIEVIDDQLRCSAALSAAKTGCQ
jgi:hypothetical protein